MQEDSKMLAWGGCCREGLAAISKSQMDACSFLLVVVVTFSRIVADEFWKASVHMALPAMRPCNLTIHTLDSTRSA